MRRTFLTLAIFFTSALCLPAKSLTVMVVNMDNLFDLDGVSMFVDYHRGYYKPKHLVKKLKNASSLISLVRAGRGPDIILFQEIESDRTPDTTISDYDIFLDRYQRTKLTEMLKEPIDYDILGYPAEAFLLKSLVENGVGKYEIAMGEDAFSPPANMNYHTTAVFSKFPIVENKSHNIVRGIPIQEVWIDIEGHPLVLFNNQWEAGDEYTSELIRISAANTLKKRIDELTQENPNLDIIIGGDLNTNYDQHARSPSWKKTAIHHTLGKQSNENSLIHDTGTQFYNLWYELDADDRYSNSDKGSLNTHMQMLLTKPLYDKIGIQYRNDSFQLLKVESLNYIPSSKRSMKWINSPNGYGLSRKLPIVARFSIVNSSISQVNEYIDIPKTADSSFGANSPTRVPYAEDLREAPLIKSKEEAINIRKDENLQKIFYIQGKLKSSSPFEVSIEGIDFHLWTDDLNLRNKIRNNLKNGDPLSFFAELSYYRKNWQLIIREANWWQE